MGIVRRFGAAATADVGAAHHVQLVRDGDVEEGLPGAIAHLVVRFQNAHVTPARGLEPIVHGGTVAGVRLVNDGNTLVTSGKGLQDPGR